MGLFGEEYGLLPIQSRIDDTHKMPIHPLIVIVALLNADGVMKGRILKKSLNLRKKG